MDKEILAALMTQNLLLEKLYQKIAHPEKPDDDKAVLGHVKFLFLTMKEHIDKGEFEK